MTFFSQAQRIHQSKSSTPGPGSHTQKIKKIVSQQCAPFGSTISRSTKPKSFPIPGPGSYEFNNHQPFIEVQFGNQQLKLAAQQKYQSVFRSKIDRFCQQSIETPGPGSYQTSPNKNTKNKNNYKKQRSERSRNLQHHQSRFAAPSIPDRVNKGYRYSQGKLIRIQEQSNQSKLGPGFYKVQSSLPKNTIINWNNSLIDNKPIKKANFNELLEQYMGPGRYNPEQYKQSKPISSSFSSKSKRYYELGRNTNTPGPGSYQCKIQTINYQYMRGQKHFGSKSSRFQTASSDHLMPGPGQYFKNKREDLNQQEDVQPVLSQKKLLVNHDITPGPGSYQLSNHYKKTTGALINSYSKKCEIFQAKQGPAPGDYSVQAKHKPNFMKPLRSLSSTSVSKTNSYNNEMCPIYNVQNFTISHKLKMNSHLNPQSSISRPFNSSCSRFKYNEVKTSQNAQTSTKSSQQTRRHHFKHPDDNRCKPSFNISSQRCKQVSRQCPGPGSYQMNLDLLKQTFNSKLLGVNKA